MPCTGHWGPATAAAPRESKRFITKTKFSVKKIDFFYKNLNKFCSPQLMASSLNPKALKSFYNDVIITFVGRK